MRNIFAGHGETVNWGNEEVVDGQERRHKRNDGRPEAGIPRRYGDGDQEQRIGRAIELVLVQEKRYAERNGDGKNGEAIALDRGEGLRELRFRLRHGRLGGANHNAFHSIMHALPA